MPVIQLADFETLPAQIVCSLCGRQTHLQDATIGPVNAEGCVTLICNGHLWDGRNFINQLADYMAKERAEFLRNNGHNMMRFGGDLA